MSNLPEKPFYHFSVDDVFKVLIEVSDSKQDLFSHSFFSFLMELNNNFGTNIDLYCFYQQEVKGKMRTLKEVSDRYKNILSENTWLRFGPHALDDETHPYRQSHKEQKKIFREIYEEIDRFVGKESRSSIVRLHYFSESFELADYFKQNEVLALLTTDKDAISYKMPEKEKQDLKENGITKYEGINFIRTHLRSENLADANFSEDQIYASVEDILKAYNFVACLTHEYELVRPEVCTATRVVLKYLSDKNIRSY